MLPASEILKDIYRKAYPERSTPDEGKMMLRAAHLIWLHAGNTIRSQIPDPEMVHRYQLLIRPDQVIARILKFRRKRLPDVYAFVAILAKNDKVSSAIRYWARDYLKEVI